jgi:hypothetical protein
MPTSMSMPAPRSPFQHLLFDPWIALSWIVALLACVRSASPLLQSHTHHTPDQVITFVLTQGYCGWAMYYGYAACWRLLLNRLAGMAAIGHPAGLVSLLLAGVLLIVFGGLYAVFGGGVYQFFKRWWLLAHGQHPPFVRSH